MSYSLRSPQPERRINYAAVLGLLLLASPWIALTACSSTTPTSADQSLTTPVTDSKNGITQEVEAVKNSAWDGFCAVAKRISWSRQDTPATVLEVKKHNHLGAVHCGWPE